MTQKNLFSRSISLKSSDVSSEDRTLTVAFASSKPYKRRWSNEGYTVANEVLSMSKDAIRMDRMNNGANLLVNHNHNDVVGVIEDVSIDEDAQVARAKVRFGESARANEIFKDVQQGIRKNMSVGYMIHKYERMQDAENKSYLVKDWEPTEISIVTMPADTSVGIGRSLEQEPKEEKVMKKELEKLNSMNLESRLTQPESKLIEPESSITMKELRNNDAEQIAKFAAEEPKLQEIAMKAIAEGKTMSEFQQIAIKHICSLNGGLVIRNNEPVTVNEVRSSCKIGLTDREARRFDFNKFLLGLSYIRENDFVTAKEVAGFELEVSRAATEDRMKNGEANMREKGGYCVPEDVLLSTGEERAISSTTTKPWIKTDILYGSFIGMLRNSLLLPGLGAVMMTGLTGNIVLPKQTSDVEAYSVVTDGKVTKSDFTASSISMKPRLIGSHVVVNRSALIQDSVGIQNLIKLSMVAQMKRLVQKMILSGSGTDPEPLGIFKNTNIAKLPGDRNGKALDWEAILALDTLIAEKNAEGDSMAYLTNARVRNKLRSTQYAPNTPGFLWQKSGDEETLAGIRAAITNAVPKNGTKGTGSNLSKIVLGNWSDLYIGFWTGLSILVDPYTGLDSGSIRVVALQNYDIAIARTESFSYADDVIA